MSTCPFCERDPFHYVDNGLGMEAVAVTCCDLGAEYFGHGDVRENVRALGSRLIELRLARELINALIAEACDQAEALQSEAS